MTRIGSNEVMTMAMRAIIEIDEEKCTGCGNCIPGCPEGALQVIDGKARLISDLFCDGLGACIGECPEDAMHVVEREAEPYEEKTVMANIVKAGPNTVIAHLKHLKDHGEAGLLREAIEYLKENGHEIPEGFSAVEACAQDEKEVAGAPMACGCPGSMVRDFTGGGQKAQATEPKGGGGAARAESQLRQWPVQIMLVPPHAPYLQGADLVISADCVPFAYANFHEDFLKDRILLVGCPKLDDANHYKEKLTQMFKENDVRSVIVVHMEVPCCNGLVMLTQAAIKDSGKAIPFADQTISVTGEKV